MNTKPKIVNPILKLHKKPEAKKVSVDDGYTQIPNELLFAMGKFGFTQRQFNLLIAVIQKTLSWHKDMDWISNSQICELVDLPDEQKASKTKQELIRMNVLVQKGNKIGLNLIVSEWEKEDCTKGASIAQNVQKKLHKSCNSDCTKGANTKETNTKEKINRVTNVTLSSDDDENPQAVVFDKNLTCPEKNNAIARTETVADSSLKKQSALNAKKSGIDYQVIADLYNERNEATGSRLPMVSTLNDKRKRAIKKFLGTIKHPTVDCAKRYFEVFFDDIKPHHLGENDRGWRATFDFAIRDDVVLRVREGAL